MSASIVVDTNSAEIAKMLVALSTPATRFSARRCSPAPRAG